MASERILILGHGAMGRMFEQLLGDHHQLAIWDRDLETGEETEPLESLVPEYPVILFALPTHPHAELAARVAACAPPRTLCLSIAKGLDADGCSPAEIFAHHFDGADLDWALIYGPMIARDLSEGRRGFAVAAARQWAVAERAAALFQDTALYLAPHDDPVGAAWAAILKNVYVPLIGMADGLGLGDNTRGFLLCEALAELARILVERGGRSETAYGLAGLGDLVTTATSASSHHRGIGEALARGERDSIAASGTNIRSEGVNAAWQVRDHGLLALADYPLFALTLSLLEEPDDLAPALADYLRRRFHANESP